MPDLRQSLQGRDLGHLRILASLWGVDFHAPDARVGVPRLAALLLHQALVAEVVEALPEPARLALGGLMDSEGRLSWAVFTRRFGEVREMGPARRDRERPYLNQNASPAEALWYRGLVGRAFFDTSAGPQEFAFIPEDLLPLIPAGTEPARAPLGRPASPAERAVSLPANDAILDHACTLLAALRLGLPPAGLDFGDMGSFPLSPTALQPLLAGAGLLDASGLPLPEPARAFLEAPRAEALAQLARAWLTSTEFDELRLQPGLVMEGDWRNDAVAARQAMLGFLKTVPGLRGGAETGSPSPYWSLAALVAAVRQAHPDFQRPAGDYDSWYIRSQATGEYLRGFEHWDEVDGALIRFLVCGPLHWLGLLDLATPEPGKPASAFRFSAWAADLLEGKPPAALVKTEEAKIHLTSDGRLRVPPLAPRSVRYQLARFGEWEGQTQEAYQYRLTPASLERARQQGLRVSHLLGLLRRQSATVPPSLVKAVERWEERGSEARLERAVVLRLSSPELLQTLRASRLGRFLGDPLGPAVVIVKPGAWKKVLAGLAEMGYLGEAELNGEGE